MPKMDMRFFMVAWLTMELAHLLDIHSILCNFHIYESTACCVVRFDLLIEAAITI